MGIILVNFNILYTDFKPLINVEFMRIGYIFTIRSFTDRRFRTLYSERIKTQKMVNAISNC